jgi:hypothetical protein
MPDCSITTKYVNFNTHKDKNNTFNSYRNFCISGNESNLVYCQKSHSFVTFNFPSIQTCSNVTSTYATNYSHTNSMHQIYSGEANRSIVSQQIFPTLWNPNVHYRFIKIPSSARILCQIQSALPPHLLKIHFNSTLPSTSRFSKWSPSLRFPHHNPVPQSSPHTCYTSNQSHSCLITKIIFGQEYTA